MRKFLLACMAVTLSGCSTYIITMKDGKTFETKSKPQLDERSGFYRIETKDGDKMQINRAEIVTIREK